MVNRWVTVSINLKMKGTNCKAFYNSNSLKNSLPKLKPLTLILFIYIVPSK